MSSRRHSTSEFTAQAVGLLEAGKPGPELAAELGISTNLPYAWRKATERPQLGSEGPRAGGERIEEIFILHRYGCRRI